MRERLTQLMTEAIASEATPAETKALFQEWIDNKLDAEKTKILAAQIVPVVEAGKDKCDTCEQIFELKNFLVKRSQWIIGGDGASYDIGYGGLDHANICKYIHLPVQSGSNNVLGRMNRKYTREWYLDRIAAIKRILPEASITTDVFCGFPSETEEDHAQTLSLMKEVGFDAAFMFKYSERPGTYAAKHLPDDIAEETKIKRLQQIIDLQNTLSAEANKKSIGKTFDVLIEGYSKRSKEHFFGRTSQNKVVVFPNGGHKIGEFVNVKITDASSATLQGELI